MRALHRYFVNPFDAGGISLSELLAFATDHLERLRAQNQAGRHDLRIAVTETALVELRQASSGDASSGGSRMASKSRKRRFRLGGTLGDQVTRVFGHVLAHYGPRSPQVRELGRKGDILRCPDDELDNRLRALHRCVAAHQATIGDAAVTLAAELVDQWAAIYEESESATGTKTRTESELRRARRALQGVLYLNLLHLVEIFPRQPEKLPLYMQPHLLRRRRRGNAAPGAESP